MRKSLLLLVLLFSVFFTYAIIAQELGSIKKGYAFSFPEKIRKLVLDPLPAGTYSVGTGGYFPTIDSVFNKLSIDGIAGEVTLELTDNLYTAPSVQFGFVLNGPIPGAGPNSRVIIKPAENMNVTIQGNNEGLLFLINTSYVTIDGVGLTGATTLTIHALQNLSYAFNDALDFINNSDHNIIQNITFIVEDISRASGSGFWYSQTGSFAPDSNLIQNNFVKMAGDPFFIVSPSSAVKGKDNIIRGNQIGSETDSLISFGIEVSRCENAIIENNIVQNLKSTLNGSDQVLTGILSSMSSGTIIRNNILGNFKANNGYSSSGIFLGGITGDNGNDNLLYNNMIYDIQSTSAQTNSRVTGIEVWYQDNTRICYNSVYLSGSGANMLGSAALYIGGTSTGVDAKNNILVNTRDESPYCASAIYDYTVVNLNSDYDDLFYEVSQYSCLVRIGSTNYNTLADWQATGKDLNSISDMPNFIDPYLHIDKTILTNIDAGATPISGIDTDFDGDLRNASTPDIGADEFITIGDTLYVPGDYSTIQEAIDAANNGDVVLVADGLYYENINYKGKAITVASHFLVDEDSTHIENTVIDGSQPSHPDSGSAVFFVNGENASSVLCGFTITGGTGTVSLLWNDRSGGGVYVELSGATICNNIIEFNSITHNDYTNAGGISIVDSDSIIVENNVIRNNSITGDNWSSGGGIAIYDFTQMGYAKVANNKIINNTVTDPNDASGGGIEINGGSNDFFIVGNYIKGNECSGYGGGLDLYDCTPNVMNNLIVENSASDGGGLVFDAIRSASSKSEISSVNIQSNRYNRFNEKTTRLAKLQLAAAFENNTVVNNIATVSGGGITVWTSTPLLMNFIIWGNTAPSDPEISGTADVQYSNVEGGYTGTGNTDLDPQFIASNVYFALSGTSPCIDAGHSDPIYNDVEDPNNPGNPWWPAQGALRNDMGHVGGSSSLWGFWDWPMPVEDESTVLSDYVLMQNYPNPFNPSTKISWQVPVGSQQTLKIYDVLGNEITTLIDDYNPAGKYEVEFNATNLPSGVYFYQLKAGEFVSTKKMILLK